MNTKPPNRPGLLKGRMQVPEALDAPMFPVNIPAKAGAAQPTTSPIGTPGADIVSLLAMPGADVDEFEPGRVGELYRPAEYDD